MKRSQHGFTMMELLTPLALVAVLTAIAVPNLRPFIQNSRLTSGSNDLLRSFQLARTEAIKRQRNVVVCASANPLTGTPTCSYGTFNGWIVFEDTNSNWQADGGETVIERHGLLDSSVLVRTDNNGIESYASSGFANPAGVQVPTRNVVMCDQRGNQVTGTDSVERALLVAATGRVRVSKSSSDITTAVAAAGACP